MSGKTIIGVPVLPGFAPLPGHVTLEDSSSDVTSEEVESTSLRSISVSSVPGAMAKATEAHGHYNWKLKHADFMPKLVKEKSMSSDADYEKFPMLWRRGCAWLQENPYALLFSCETVTWMTVDRPIFSDNGILIKSMGDKKTKMMRGLRIWYFTADDTFYDAKNLPVPCKFGYINYVPEGKNDSLGNMLARLNNDLKNKPVAGIILRVESLMCNQEVSDADTSCWSEQPAKDRSYYTFFRIYFTEFPEDKQQYGDLAIRDFVAQNTQRSVHNNGYETYNELWRKAARWIYNKPDCQCVNLQSVFVKLKKDASEGEMVDRVYHMEHGSAHSTLSNTKTEYLQIIRLIYFRPAHKEIQEHGLKMAYKTFYPSRLKRSRDVSEDEAEQAYEDLGQTEERVNSWLTFSGARMIGVETVPVRLRSGGQETLGTEATYVVNGREKNYHKELWRNNIRIYLEGAFREAPVTWSKSVVDTGNTPVHTE